MRRFLNPFVAVLTGILALVYAYLAWRLTTGVATRLALALPFLLIWVVPLVYWVGERESGRWTDELVHFASYACMGWLNFVLLLCLVRDAVLLSTLWLAPLSGLHGLLRDSGAQWVLVGSFVALAFGVLAALRGPHVRHIDIPVQGLDPGLHGVRIVQITDLHVGPTIRAAYVRRVVRMSNQLAPDLVALTGDFVDGSVARSLDLLRPWPSWTSAWRPRAPGNAGCSISRSSPGRKNTRRSPSPPRSPRDPYESRVTMIACARVRTFDVDQPQARRDIYLPRVPGLARQPALALSEVQRVPAQRLVVGACRAPS